MSLRVCSCSLTLLYSPADYLPPPSLSDPDVVENKSHHEDRCWKCDLSTSPLVRGQPENISSPRFASSDITCHICGMPPCQTPKYSRYGGDACSFAPEMAQFVVLPCGRICHVECIEHGELSATVVIGEGENLKYYRRFLEDVGINVQSEMFGDCYGTPLTDGCRYLKLRCGDEVLVTRVGIKQGELGWLFGSRSQNSALQYHGQANHVSGQADCGWFPLCLIAAPYPRPAQCMNALCWCAICDDYRNFAAQISLHELEVLGAMC